MLPRNSAGTHARNSSLFKALRSWKRFEPDRACLCGPAALRLSIVAKGELEMRLLLLTAAITLGVACSGSAFAKGSGYCNKTKECKIYEAINLKGSVAILTPNFRA